MLFLKLWYLADIQMLIFSPEKQWITKEFTWKKIKNKKIKLPFALLLTCVYLVSTHSYILLAFESFPLARIKPNQKNKQIKTTAPSKMSFNTNMTQHCWGNTKWTSPPRGFAKSYHNKSFFFSAPILPHNYYKWNYGFYVVSPF